MGQALPFLQGCILFRGIGEFDIGLVQDQVTGGRQLLGKFQYFVLYSGKTRRIVRIGDENQGGGLVHPREQGLPGKAEIRIQRDTPHGDAAEFGLQLIHAETGVADQQVVLAGSGQNPDQKIDGFIRSVAHEQAVLGERIEIGQGLVQLRGTGPRVAESQGGVSLDAALNQRGHAKGVFIAGELDDPVQLIPGLYVFHGQAGGIRFKVTNLGLHFGWDPGAVHSVTAGSRNKPHQDDRVCSRFLSALSNLKNVPKGRMSDPFISRFCQIIVVFAVPMYSSFTEMDRSKVIPGENGCCPGRRNPFCPRKSGL